MSFRDGTDIQIRECSLETSTFGEHLIDCEEDRVLRGVLVGMLRDADRRRDR